MRICDFLVDGDLLGYASENGEDLISESLLLGILNIVGLHPREGLIFDESCILSRNYLFDVGNSQDELAQLRLQVFVFQPNLHEHWQISVIFISNLAHAAI